MNEEANRCLLCKNARCSAACPVRTAVPELMKLYREGRYEEAGRILFDNNPLSAITSQVCDWKKFCYGHCILNAKKVPVRWYEIEQELSMAYILKAEIETEPENGKRIAIIGGGPAGITAAIMLREKGYSIDLFDENPRLGGVLRYGIPAFRLDRKHIDAYERIFLESGIAFHGDIRISSSDSELLPVSPISDGKMKDGQDGDYGICGRVTFESLREDYDAVFISSGAGVPRKLDVPGEEGNPNVLYALDYLREPATYRLGRKVIVIGGGNVTMDASRTANREGHDTWIYYRKTIENMPANSDEIEQARKEGVKFELFQVPVAVKEKTIVMRDCENVVREDGRVSTRMIEGSDHEVDYDTLIIAISANVDYGFFGESTPVSDEKGMPAVNSDQSLTFDDDKKCKVFVAGDFLLGPKTVVEAVASAKTAADNIDNQLRKS